MKNEHKIFSLLASLLLFGCFSNEPSDAQHSSETTVSYPDPYDDPNIDEGYLEKNLCMVFEDLRFVKGKGGKNDHVFIVKEGMIDKHKSYPKKEIALTSFQSVVGWSLFDAMGTIGIPSFRGRYDEDPSLTYVISPEAYATIYIEKNELGEWIVSSYKTFDESEFSKDFGRDYNSPDVQRNAYVPSFERIRSIPMGMLFDDVLFILGRPGNAGTYHGSPSRDDPNGAWNLNLKNQWVEISARWIGSDYPAFEIENCQNGNTSYFGVVRVYISGYMKGI